MRELFFSTGLNDDAFFLTHAINNGGSLLVSAYLLYSIWI